MNMKIIVFSLIGGIFMIVLLVLLEIIVVDVIGYDVSD